MSRDQHPRSLIIDQLQFNTCLYIEGVPILGLNVSFSP